MAEPLDPLDPLDPLRTLLDEWEANSGSKVEGLRYVAAHPYRHGVQDLIDQIRAALDLPEPAIVR